jgi:transposase
VDVEDADHRQLRPPVGEVVPVQPLDEHGVGLSRHCTNTQLVLSGRGEQRARIERTPSGACTVGNGPLSYSQSSARHGRAATTTQLLLSRDWLGSFAVTLVAMEATGVFWRPVYYLLEDDFECWLLNAQHLHNVPGRKTDVADAAWIAELTEHGLVRPSFVPPKPIRELRNLTRYRRVVIQDRAREVQRLHKVLEEAGVKLSSVASKVLGASGRAMVEALIRGTRDPELLAELAKGRLRKKMPALREALDAASPRTTPCCARRCSLASIRPTPPSSDSHER